MSRRYKNMKKSYSANLKEFQSAGGAAKAILDGIIGAIPPEVMYRK